MSRPRLANRRDLVVSCTGRPMAHRMIWAVDSGSHPLAAAAGRPALLRRPPLPRRHGVAVKPKAEPAAAGRLLRRAVATTVLRCLLGSVPPEPPGAPDRNLHQTGVERHRAVEAAPARRVRGGHPRLAGDPTEAILLCCRRPQSEPPCRRRREPSSEPNRQVQRDFSGGFAESLESRPTPLKWLNSGSAPTVTEQRASSPAGDRGRARRGRTQPRRSGANRAHPAGGAASVAARIHRHRLSALSRPAAQTPPERERARRTLRRRGQSPTASPASASPSGSDSP